MGVDIRIEEVLERQRGVGATWQFKEAGCKKGSIEHARGELRRVHDGVFVSGHGPLTSWQRWKAATLTTRTSYLGVWSAARFYGLRADDRIPTTVCRVGQGGSVTTGTGHGYLGSTRIFFRTRLEGDTAVVDGIDVVTAARTTLELVAHLPPDEGARAVRDALRLKVATALDLRAQTAKHHGNRGVAQLRALVDEYAALPLGRTRSDAEALDLALLHAAGAVVPDLNVVIAGHEADLVRRDLGLIVELDGPQFHQFEAVDAKKQAAWEMAGLVVRRLPTDDVFDRPHLLLAAATTPPTEAERSTAAATRSADDVMPRLRLLRRTSSGLSVVHDGL